MGELEAVVEAIRAELTGRSAAREQALALARETIRTSANAIRAIHRHELAKARAMADEAGQAIHRAVELLADHPDVLHAGFVHDAAKEFVEARVVLALVQGEPPPTPDELDVRGVTYLHGLAESVGELRRHLLDYLRRDEVERCEPLLERMDEVYALLVTIDFPDALTAGLRRSTDAVRGILEKTRGDLTVALRQRGLETRMAELEAKLAR